MAVTKKLMELAPWRIPFQHKPLRKVGRAVVLLLRCSSSSTGFSELLKLQSSTTRNNKGCPAAAAQGSVGRERTIPRRLLVPISNLISTITHITNTNKSNNDPSIVLCLAAWSDCVCRPLTDTQHVHY